VKTNNTFRLILKFFDRIFSIKLTLVMSLVLLTLIPAGIILIITLVGLADFVQKDIENNSLLVGKRTFEYITNYVTSPFRISQNIAFIADRKRLITTDIDNIKDLLFPMFITNPSVSYVYFGAEDNTFAGYTIGTTSQYSFTVLENNTYWAVDVVNNVTGATATPDPSQMSYLDLNTQEWYYTARANYVPKWIGPYFIPNNIYNDPHAIYLSAFYPWYNESSPRKEVLGVGGCDIIISTMTSFLQSVSTSQNSAVYIIENNGFLMVAGSKPTDVYFNISSDLSTMNRLTLSQSSDPTIAALGAELQQEYGLTIKAGQILSKSYHVNGVSIFLDPHLFSDQYGLDWTILVIIAQSDFTGPTDQFRNTILITDTIVIVVTIAFGLILAYAITMPLIRLGSKMENLRKMKGLTETKSDNKISPFSRLKLFHEVRVLDRNFSNLEKAVQGFMKFVPREIVMDFLNEPNGEDMFRPFVTEKNVAILFSDIANFTSITEKLHPRQLISMLNLYFEETSVVIRLFSGTLDKYIGDSLMSFWNAPKDVPLYEVQACRAALKMQKVIGQLNERFSTDGLPCFYTRIGVHAGDVLVGNTGSSYRLSYTIMGDSVNLGSRLEGLNKMYGTSILISNSCKRKVERVMTTRLIDRVAVKGKQKGVKVYELIGEGVSDEIMAEANRYTSIMHTYFKREFSDALIRFEEYLQQRPNDVACLQMIERCKMYIQVAPPADWTGIDVKHEK
jgi:adenylate cyclase